MRDPTQIGDAYANHLFNQVMDGNSDRRALLAALRKIARGRTDNGRPLAAEESRQIARECIAAVGERWNT